MLSEDVRAVVLFMPPLPLRDGGRMQDRVTAPGGRGPSDWLLVDAPCHGASQPRRRSGSGGWTRGRGGGGRAAADGSGQGSTVQPRASSRAAVSSLFSCRGVR